MGKMLIMVKIIMSLLKSTKAQRTVLIGTSTLSRRLDILRYFMMAIEMARERTYSSPTVLRWKSGITGRVVGEDVILSLVNS